MTDSAGCRPRSSSGSTCTTRSSRPGLCTGCAGCVIACPHDVLGYRDDEGIYKPFQIGGRLRPDRLQPRPEGLHVLHAGVPTLSRLGARDRRVPLRRPAPARRGVGRLQGHRAGPRRRPRARTRSARTAGSSRRSSSTRSSTTSSTPRSSRYLEGDGSTWKAIPGVARTTRGRDRLGRQPLHVLGEHARVHRGGRERRGAHRARRDELPVLDPAGDEAAQGRARSRGVCR